MPYTNHTTTLLFHAQGVFLSGLATLVLMSAISAYEGQCRQALPSSYRGIQVKILPCMHGCVAVEKTNICVYVCVLVWMGGWVAVRMKAGV